MSSINDYLDYISAAHYGRDVRDAIVSSIRECYKDATGHPDSVAALVQEYIDREEKIDGAVTALTGFYNSLGDIVYSYDYTNFETEIHIDSGEFECVDHITLGPGKWIIQVVSSFFQVRDAAPNKATFYLSLSDTLNEVGYPTPISGYRLDEYAGTILNSSVTNFHFIRMISLTEETTIYMWIKHPGDISNDYIANPRMIAMKIGDASTSDGTTIADQVVENTSSISTLNEKVNTNTTDITSLQEDLSTVNGSIETINTNITEANTKLSSLTLGIEPETRLAMLYSNGTPIGDAIDVSGSLEPLTVDSELDVTSVNPIQNKAVASKISKLDTLVEYKTLTVTSGNVSIPSGGFGLTTINIGNTGITVVGATPYVDNQNHPIILLGISQIEQSNNVVIVNYYNPTNNAYTVKIGVTLIYYENT